MFFGKQKKKNNRLVEHMKLSIIFLEQIVTGMGKVFPFILQL